MHWPPPPRVRQTHTIVSGRSAFPRVANAFTCLRDECNGSEKLCSLSCLLINIARCQELQSRLAQRRAMFASPRWHPRSDTQEQQKSGRLSLDVLFRLGM